jgi:CO/xanthine dehydrogenase Mo-binding subunit
MQRRAFFPTPGACVNEHTARADARYGAKGVGEPPTVVSTAAIVAALRGCDRARAHPRARPT